MTAPKLDPLSEYLIHRYGLHPHWRTYRQKASGSSIRVWGALAYCAVAGHPGVNDGYTFWPRPYLLSAQYVVKSSIYRRLYSEQQNSAESPKAKYLDPQEPTT
jgi:hypothetical protein